MSENVDTQPGDDDNTHSQDSSVNNRPEPNKQSSQSQEFQVDTSQWSWGAFMLDAPFLIAIQKYVYLLVYLVWLIPFLNFIVYIAFKIYLGLKGRELAQDSPAFASSEERDGFFKAFDWAGKVLFFVSLAFFVLGLLFSLTVGVGMLDAMMMQSGFNG